MANILGIDKTLLSGGEDSQDLNDILLIWANELIEDLKESLDTETSTGTSKNLRQSMKVVPSSDEVVEVGISMLDYWDYTNKGVKGVGGSDKGLKQVFGQYAFSSTMPDWRVGTTLEQWANAKQLSSFMVAKSIFQRGIEGKQWFDKVFTEDRVNDLIKRVSEAAGKQMAVGIRKTIEKSK